MSFFNRKEEVLEISLTPYGKRLLATGNFKPEFYAFYDDDILYDGKYGFLSSSTSDESQTNINKRIKETPRSHTQHSFDNVDAEAEQRDGIYGLKISTLDREYSLALPLGESDQSDNFPAWSILFLEGELSGVLHHTTGSFNKKTGIIRIPQLTTLDIISKTKVEKLKQGVDLNVNLASSNEEECSDLLSEDFFPGGDRIFPDETFISLENGSLILEIEEFNTEGDYQNFDIEVFEMIDKEENLRPLYFQKPPDQIQNNLLVSDQDPKDTFLFSEPTEEYAEYYMNIEVDDEIGRRLLCSKLPKDSPTSLQSKRMLNCDEFEDENPIDERSLYDFPDDEIEEQC